MQKESIPEVRREFFPHIESLRAIAVLLVIASHIETVTFRAGFIGVDIFFVISGFLITGILLKDAPRINLRAFYLRRARRILPAALTVALVTLVASALVYNPLRMQIIFNEFLWTIFQAANIGFQLNGVGYFVADLGLSPFHHYWSLGVEEQFYLIWPLLLVVLLVTLKRRWLPLGLLAVMLASIAAMFELQRIDPQVAYLNLGARGWELAAGGLLAALWLQVARLKRWVAALAALAGLVAITASLQFVNQHNFTTTLWLPVLGAMLVIAGGHTLGHWSLLGNPALRFMGRISYSLYLWHWPTFYFIDLAEPRPSLARSVLIVGLSLALATLSWRFVEQPFLRRRGAVPVATVDPKPPVRLRTTALATITVIAMVALTTAVPANVRIPKVASGSMPTVIDPLAATLSTNPTLGYVQALAAHQRLIADTQASLAQAPVSASQLAMLEHSISLQPTWGDRSQTEFWQCTKLEQTLADHCTNREQPTNPSETWIIIGDSFAEMWLPTLRTIAERNVLATQRFLTYTLGQCNNTNEPALFQTSAADLIERCLRFHQLALESLAQQEIDPDSTVRLILADVFDAPSKGEQYKQAAAEFAQQLQGVSGADALYFVETKPYQRVPLNCLNAQYSNGDDCANLLSKRFDGTLLKAEVANHLGAEYINTAPWFCTMSSARCPIFIADTLVSIDGAHVSPYMAEALSALFALAVTRP